MGSQLATTKRVSVPNAAQPSRKWFAGKTVGHFVPRITRKAFQKFGFASADLLSGWPTIVGREVAAFAVPERLKWPRRDCAITGDAETRSGATLVLRVEGARALELQYRAQDIIERINGYFGYAAVRELRLVQGPVGSLGSPSMGREPKRAPATGSTVHICALPVEWGQGGADQNLRDALARLGARVHGG